MALPSSGAITLAMIQAEFGGANPISLSEYYKGGAYVTASDVAPNVPTSGIISLANFRAAFKNVIGQIAYTTPGTYTWTVPAHVSSVCVVCIGSGTGDGAGSLSWGNNIPVSAGQQFLIKVGDVASSISYFGSTGILYAGAGADRGGAYAGGGGNGGSNNSWTGGGGAGGYTGNGGVGGAASSPGVAGAGGGGGSGGGYDAVFGSPAGGGGGTGILGQGANGAGGVNMTAGGGGGSGGANGGGGWEGGRGAGGKYGGGGDGTGAVRIIWGAYRSFPSTNTGNL